MKLLYWPCALAAAIVNCLNLEWNEEPIIRYFESESCGDCGIVTGYISPIPGLVGLLECAGAMSIFFVPLMCLGLCCGGFSYR